MKKIAISLVFASIVCGAFLISSCSQATVSSADDRALATLASRLVTQGARDPQEGSNPDFASLSVAYSQTTVYVTLNYYNPVSALSWGDPYVYFDDAIDPEANDMLVFDSPTTYQLRRDKNNDGAYETLVYSGAGVSQNAAGTSFSVKIPRGALPDLTSRSVWAYSMTSHDRVPDAGAIAFSTNVSVHLTDVVEGASPDFVRLKAGFDGGILYFETEVETPVTNYTWGSPYLYLYDSVDPTQSYMIAFVSNSTFEVRRDSDSDGAFETLVYTGSSGMRLEDGKRFTQIVPIATIPSPQTKQIWAYSMTSLDRIPDAGHLHF